MNSPLVQRKKFSIGKAIGWALLLLLAIFPVLISLGYLTMNPENFSFADQKATYTAHLTMLMMHILGAMLAILIGPFQFLPGIRKGRWLKVHRWLGRTYLLSILCGGLSGLYMAQLAYGGSIVIGQIMMMCIMKMTIRTMFILQDCIFVIIVDHFHKTSCSR